MQQRLLSSVVLLGCLAGCAMQESPKSMQAAQPKATMAPAAASDDFYQEMEHDGRIYVFGTEKAFQASKDAPHFAYAKTFIGTGSGGGSVALEAHSKDVALQNRLMQTFTARGHAEIGQDRAASEAPLFGCFFMPV